MKFLDIAFGRPNVKF